MNFLKLLSVTLAALVIGLAAAPQAFAQADGPSTRVIVPDVPGGAVFTGCYNVSQRMYGPYRLQFCLERRGSYTVTGGGVRCEGRLNWSASGRDINVQLERSRCGNGVAWSADRMTCRGQSLLSAILSRVIVPDAPVLSTLRCNYLPSAAGFRPMTITARRID